MNPEHVAEAQTLEAALRGAAPPPHRPAGVCGRLAQLYLEPPLDSEQVQRALSLAEAGLSLVTADDPLYPKLEHVLAMALRSVTDPPADALGPQGKAATLDREAWQRSIDAVQGEALALSRDWGDWAWAAERWAEAGEAYGLAQRALDRTILRSTSKLLDRLETLRTLSYVALRGAYALAHADRSRDATVLLERAAYLLLSNGQQSRDIEGLAAIGQGNLRDALMAAHERLNELRATGARDQYGHLSPQQRQAQTRVDDLVRQVRELPGMATFALPSGWADIQQAAEHGPIVYLAPTDKGTLMLAVLQGATQIAVAFLQDTAAGVTAAARGFLRREFGDVRVDSKGALLELLEWLGIHLMSPVFQAVGGDRSVVLIPFGLLSELPLHAALLNLPGRLEGTTDRHHLFHPAHVTYAGSARSLVLSRLRAERGNGISALVINNPAPPPQAYGPLHLSNFERDVVAAHFHCDELSGYAATTENVLDDLPAADIIHFTCHGTVDNRYFYTGILLIADNQILTVQHWERAPELRARLVVLSACRSGTAAVGIAQTVSLPSVLTTVGVACVVATFWHTDEMATLQLITKFYELWDAGRGLGPAEALGSAVAWLCLSTAGVLRATVSQAALDDPAGQALRDAPADSLPYADPWYWAPFFLTGA